MSDLAARRAAYVAAIEEYVKRVKTERGDTLLPQEIGKLPNGSRALVLMKAMFAGVVRYYRKNPTAPVTLGVQIASTLFADNQSGACTLSADTLARLLGRHPRKIYEARAASVENGTL